MLEVKSPWNNKNRSVETNNEEIEDYLRNASKVAKL